MVYHDPGLRKIFGDLFCVAFFYVGEQLGNLMILLHKRSYKRIIFAGADIREPEISERFADPARQHAIGELKLKMSGCINACGHHHVGHIGVLGVDKHGVETYQLTVGGSAAEDAAIVINGVYPQGTIQFKDRGVALGTPVALVLDTAAGKMTASYTTTTSSLTALAIGSHGITGTLSSTNTNFLTGTVSSESLFTVTPATTVTTASTVTLASTATTAEAGTSVTLTATVTAATAGLVEFWDGTTYLGRGSIVSGRVTLAVNAAAIPLSVGTHTIQARFVGSTTVRASVSSNLTLTIT